jgi:mannose-1-phosphate guanylyltransferase
MQKLIPVILAGGSGERFWPVSRRAKPKQFLSLDGTGQTLLQATVGRLQPLCNDIDDIYIVCNEMHRGIILEQLPDLPLENLIAEPEAKDTAAAILLATLRIIKMHGTDTIIGVFPSDHNIGSQIEFQNTIEHAHKLAENNHAIVTLGIKPTFASTGYGYIQSGTDHNQHSKTVQRFVEKPNLETAETYLERGGYYWNGGMFIYKTSVMQNAFTKYAPDILEALEHCKNNRELKNAYQNIRKISIDYAILEPSSLANEVLVVPTTFLWDDLGDWNALARLLQGDNPNLEIGSHLGLDTSGAILYTTTGDDLIVTLGLEDVLIVRDGNVTLVAHKHRTQDIRHLVAKLRAEPEFVKFI